MNINFYQGIKSFATNFCSNNTKTQGWQTPTIPEDSFVKEPVEFKYLRKMEEIFPNGELEEIYDNLCKELELDYKPKLFLKVPIKNSAGGGYTFHNNSINISLEDTFGSNIKLYGVKNGKEIFQLDELGNPIMANKKIAKIIVENPKAAKHRGYDKIIAKPATNEDLRKLFLQKLYHELIHAKQHMIMRQTEGIGSKKIFDTWITKNKPTSVPKQKLDAMFEKSFWANKFTPTEYSKDSETGRYAHKLLKSVKNYAPVTSPQYKKNLLEVEAYKKSYEYIVENFGEWK